MARYNDTYTWANVDTTWTTKTWDEIRAERGY